jgi:hypothetical protein
MRSLASVQSVRELKPIEGADRIEVACILGWEVVVKRGQFSVGDLGCLIEIDSIVPATPVFEFMKERKYRVRTIRLKKQVSQGLFMSFNDLGITNTKRLKEGDDLTIMIGVTKWEPDENNTAIYQGKGKKSLWWKLVYTLPFLKMFRKRCGPGASFPSHLVPKTDETRLQAFGPDFLETYKDLPIAISQKMDGSSTTFVWNKGKFSVASRNVWYIEKKDNNFWKVAELTGIAKAVKEVFGKRNVCLQGEVCGPSIQDNRYKFDSLHYFLFGIFDSDKKEYFTPQELIDALVKMCEAGSTIEIVDQLVTPSDGKTIKDIGLTVDEWLAYVETKSRFNPETWNEGVVVRSLDNKPYAVKGMEGGRWSWKIVSNKYLLQYGL